MIVLARLLARLTGIALMALIAVVGAAAAVFCISGGHTTLSLAGLASDIHLPALRQDVDFFSDQTTTHGSVAIVAALGGAAAVLTGLVLIAGCWIPPRPWRIVLVRERDGSLGTRRRPLADLAAELAERNPDVAQARARARARRRHDGGRIRLRARATVPADRGQARQGARESAAALIESVPLRLRVSARRASRRQRREALEAAG